MIRSLKECNIYSPKEQKKIHYDDSLLLTCKSYDFQVYPKYRQMLDRNISGASSAIGVVRFELRAGRQKLNSIMGKHRVDWPGNFIDSMISLVHHAPEEEIKGYLMLSVGTGDFFTRAEVKKRILSSKFQARVQDKMLNLVDLLTRYSNIQKLFDQNLIDSIEWRKLLLRFNSIQCSPITIPSSFKHQTMPGVLSW